MPKGTLALKYVDPKSLRLWEGNPRRHGEEDVATLAKSMEIYGFTNPILVQRGTNRVLAGHGRLEAAKKVGLDRVPVIELDLDEAKAAGYTVMDNKSAENSEWDFGRLRAMLVEMDDGQLDLFAMTGFPEAELKGMVDWQPKALRVFEASVADGVRVCVCKSCGHEHASQKKKK